MTAGTQTPLSLNEIRFFFTRAAVGAGAPFGLGEDFAKASIWLAGRGIDPVRPAAAALASLAKGQSGTRLAACEEEGVVYLRSDDEHPVSAVYAGPALADRLAVAAEVGGGCRIVLRQVDQPALVAAAVAAAEIDAPGLCIFWPSRSGARIVVNSRCGHFEVLADDAAEFDAAGPVDMEARLSRPAPVAEPPPHPPARRLMDHRDRAIEEGVTVAAAPWSVVYGYFAKCLVPSSEHSRATGAGAGLTDNN